MGINSKVHSYILEISSIPSYRNKILAVFDSNDENLIKSYLESIGPYSEEIHSMFFHLAQAIRIHKFNRAYYNR